MATVKELLDRLAAGEISTDEVAADFRGRKWAKRSPATKAQVYGVEDTEPADEDNDWGLVNEDPRLTSAQYEILSKAMLAGR